MSIRRTRATAGRVLTQLSHDRRTLALLFVVPPLLMTLLKYVFRGEVTVFNSIAPMLLGVFPMVIMFLITSIATLRERSSGTLDRLMTTPISKLDFILGYAFAFFIIAFLQAVITGTVLLWLLKVTVAGGVLPTLASAALAALLGTALGLLASAFAKTEFQAVQFLPALYFPQLLTCGLFVARDHMARGLQYFADIMPLTYSVDAMQQVSRYTGWSHTLIKDLIIVGGYAILALLIGSVTIRRRERT